MTELWNKKGLPHKGWEHNHCEDTGDMTYTCEMCGNSIRYVHHLSHPDYKESIGVGCVCAEKLTNDYITPRQREKSIRPIPKKQLQRWLDNGWKTSQHGNLYKNIKNINIVISKYSNGYSFIIRESFYNPHTGEKYHKEVYKGKNFETLEDAKISIYYKKRELK